MARLTWGLLWLFKWYIDVCPYFIHFLRCRFLYLFHWGTTTMDLFGDYNFFKDFSLLLFPSLVYSDSHHFLISPSVTSSSWMESLVLWLWLLWKQQYFDLSVREDSLTKYMFLIPTSLNFVLAYFVMILLREVSIGCKSQISSVVFARAFLLILWNLCQLFVPPRGYSVPSLLHRPTVSLHI